MELPSAFLAFYEDFDYSRARDVYTSLSRACSFCSDFDLDVLELFINGVNFIAFFDVTEFTACSFFCEINNIAIGKYVFCI